MKVLLQGLIANILNFEQNFKAEFATCKLVKVGYGEL